MRQHIRVRGKRLTMCGDVRAVAVLLIYQPEHGVPPLPIDHNGPDLCKRCGWALMIAEREAQR